MSECVPQTLADLCKDIAKRFPRRVMGTPGSRAQTGEFYVVLGTSSDGDSVGVVPDGAAFEVFRNEQTAVAAAHAAFNAYAAGRRGTLYWRQMPRLDMVRGGRFRVYLRLLISDAPVLSDEPKDLKPDAAASAIHAPIEPADKYASGGGGSADPDQASIEEYSAALAGAEEYKTQWDAERKREWRLQVRLAALDSAIRCGSGSILSRAREYEAYLSGEAE